MGTKCTESELAAPYHCAGLRVLAGGSRQDWWLRARDRLGVALLFKKENKDKTEVSVCRVFDPWSNNWWIKCSHLPIYLFSTFTNLGSRCDTEATIGTDLRFLLLRVGHRGALLLRPVGPLRDTRVYQHFVVNGTLITFLPYGVASLKATPHHSKHWRYNHLEVPKPLCQHCITPGTRQSKQCNTSAYSSYGMTKDSSR